MEEEEEVEWEEEDDEMSGYQFQIKTLPRSPAPNLGLHHHLSLYQAIHGYQILENNCLCTVDLLVQL